MREPDFAFGHTMLTLRSATGLTQAALAAQLGVSRNAVVGWETGASYPHAPHLQKVIELALGHQAFTAGAEAAEIRALWSAAHQKVGLDEGWMATLLTPDPAAPPPALDRTISAGLVSSNLPRRLDWSDAPVVTRFYGRGEERDLLATWLVEARCRVVSVLGQGGIGKSALATQVMQRVAPDFEVIIWRSLRDVPTCDALLDSCLQVLLPQALSDASASPESRQDHLLDCLRRRRVLLIYDNLESFLEDGVDSGHLRIGYASFARLLRRVADTAHQSCLLLTSREKPRDLVPLEGSGAPVRALRLSRLDAAACGQLLAEQGVAGSAAEQLRLVEAYGGNPLALKIVARTIVDLFAGQIAPFLEQGEVVFGGVRDLLAEQYARLSGTEQTALLWLAVLREPATLPELLAVLGTPLPPAQVLDALESLRRRSLIEPGPQAGSFTLQSVVMEYVTARLIAEVTGEIQQGRCARLVTHGLESAADKEYVRQAQQRLFVEPILADLRRSYPARPALEDHLLGLLARLREQAADTQGYGPANLLALLHAQRGHLRGLDLSHLVLRGMDLQGVEMQDTTLAGATLWDCVWTATFGAIWAVAISPDGRYWAAGSRRGELWVWAQQTLHLSWSAHADVVRALSFSPDGRHLASGSYDGTVKVWDVQNGALLWRGAQITNVSAVAYSPAGDVVASAGTDGTVRLWEAQTGALLELLPHPQAVFTLAWNPHGQLLASLGAEGQIRLWQRQPSGPATCLAALAGHRSWGMGLAFAPDGCTLASASWDQTIQLWDLGEGGALPPLVGHRDRVQTVAWSPDGRTLASAGFDETIWLWDVASRSYRLALAGFTGVVFSLAFTPDSRKLLSGSTDGTLRLWNVENGQSEQIWRGYADSLYDVTWSPDGARLASGSSTGAVTLWDAHEQTPPRVLQGHRYLVFGVAWSPDGRWLASSGWDNAIRIWDAHTGTSVQVLQQPDDAYTSFYGIAWSPDGRRLACGNYRREVQVWEVGSGTRQWIARAQPASARRVAWSPDGARLVSAGDDGIVYLWNAADGSLLRQMGGHHGKVNDVAWSRDGQWLASGGGGSDGGEVFIWDPHAGQCVRVLAGQPGIVYTVAWAPAGGVLISGGSDGRLRWWDRESGQCLREGRADQGTIQSLQVSPEGQRLASCGDDGAIHIWDLDSGVIVRTYRRDRPYERLDIGGATGLTPAQRASLHALGATEETPVD